MAVLGGYREHEGRTTASPDEHLTGACRHAHHFLVLAQHSAPLLGVRSEQTPSTATCSCVAQLRLKLFLKASTSTFTQRMTDTTENHHTPPPLGLLTNSYSCTLEVRKSGCIHLRPSLRRTNDLAIMSKKRASRL